DMPENSLSDHCMEAVERAPVWLRNDLINNLNRIGGEWAEFSRDMVADVILDAAELQVDEVAFTLAHVSPILLENVVLELDLFIENAETIYESDEYLDYVTIVEHGDFDEGDYWTTLEYDIRTEDDEVIRVEIDRDIYYWHVVHPRLSDEEPLYIDPATGRQRQPDVGKFWRNFLLNEPDDGYTSLRDQLEDCEVLWSNLVNNGTEENGAIGLITMWIRDVLEFTSRQERPIQPVRIYRMHIGRCGEHSDLTAAAGRAALIPTVCTSTFCTDHTWNEFWDGDRWVVWEPVNNYVDSAPYDNWNELPAVFDWRSDASVWTVTDRYTDHADFNVTIRDWNGRPVDGAKIMLASEYLHGGLMPCTWGYTDSDGRVSFTIGDNRTIYLRVESGLGNFPQQANSVTRVISNSQADREYNWSHQFDRRMPRISAREADDVADPTNHFQGSLAYEMLSETADGIIFTDAEFFMDVADARLDFFICDEENYRNYLNEENFEAYNIEELTESGEIGFVLPTDHSWYAVFSNATSLANYMEAEVATTFSVSSEFAVDERGPDAPVVYRLYRNYPNPFNSGTRIPFQLGRSGNTAVSIFDMAGRRLFTGSLGNLSAGSHVLTFDGSGLNSGVYIYEMRCNGFTDRNTMIIMK
ncbi:MAG TPA: T9SS type A sorting domain-containing protein, partial [Bacteroidetes bacterium]|nr:T9SS type A sorting domain-containing protein [Bacteroidota bacterium]